MSLAHSCLNAAISACDLDVQSDLALAIEIAQNASALAFARFQQHNLRVHTKPDLTPVSDADLAAERLVRQQLAQRRPNDGVIGEEFAQSDGKSTRKWIVDPIDGTKNFVRGVPVWATLLALVDGDEVILSAVAAPALGRYWWAERGQGAYSWHVGGKVRKLATSDVSTLDDASLSFSSLSGWRERDRYREFLELTDAVWRVRAYGDFWSYMLVAEGACDIAAEPELNLYDMAALVPIVTEAGGIFTDLAGVPGPFGTNAVATNGKLHAQVLARLQ